ncbi:L,D-transpeptidase family protein [Pseudooceanicola sp. 216_PA32_1]|jgi:murein L,D-transpeptidase YafK|uniref:L,D-transpeptidase family protein n=1 Tax=Pseudooceanicola pacificus TaxID=2676438 RepID=A0A844VYX9_9RHOB|nr:L,D-transpeptidase family protein [Pseudooceanicola pacificus]MWB76966.1 L,D-transpeptidase family protein [Pseudooceanicola pacificus]
MRFVRLILILTLGLSVVACSKFKTYNGPEVTRVYVFKEQRKLYLMHHNTVLEAYDFGLGFAPSGHKQFEGDGRTPEGEYVIDRRNPNSQFHLSVGISYPNQADREFASSQGKSPGGDIFIHGRPKKYRNGVRDWTAGCIAVTDKEIEQIYAMVRDGTPISIYP